MTRTKTDVQALKRGVRLELLMQETGEAFDVDPTRPEIWISRTVPGLIVDTRRQVFELQVPGKNLETGDVFTWLQRRYGWRFGMALKYLEGRRPDAVTAPVPEHQPATAEGNSRRDERPSAALDRYQKEALALVGECIREYFNWPFDRFLMHAEEIRLTPVYAGRVTECGRCGRRLDWSATEVERGWAQGGPVERPIGIGTPVIAYSITKRLNLLDYIVGYPDGNVPLEALNDVIDAAGPIFATEEDNVICAGCARDELNFQRALQLCEVSAQRRWQADEKAALPVE